MLIIMLAYVLCYIYIITFVLFGTEGQVTVLVVDVDAKEDVQVFWFIFSDEVFTDVTYTVSICNCVYNYILQLEIHNGCWIIVSLRVHSVTQKCTKACRGLQVNIVHVYKLTDIMQPC